MNKIRQLIAEDKLQQAIELLKKTFTHTPVLNEVLLQSARYRNIMKQIRSGVVDFEKANLTLNQIRAGLLELLTEIEFQQQQNPNIKEELKQAISIINSKNIILGGQISVGGDIQIGDKTVQTESKLSQRIRIFLFVFVPLLTICFAFFWYKYKISLQDLSLKVSIQNRTPNDYLPSPEGQLTLIYGGKSEIKQGVIREAIFESIPSKYKEETLKLQYLGEGFKYVDTAFIYSDYITLPIFRNNDLAKLNGIVYEEKGKQNIPLKGVEVNIPCCEVFTNSAGQFQLNIPFEHQREEQRLDFFKQGYFSKSTTTPIIKGEIFRIYLTKQ